MHDGAVNFGKLEFLSKISIMIARGNAPVRSAPITIIVIMIALLYNFVMADCSNQPESSFPPIQIKCMVPESSLHNRHM